VLWYIHIPGIIRDTTGKFKLPETKVLHKVEKTPVMTVALPSKSLSVLIVVRASKRNGIYNHLDTSLKALRASFPSSKLQVFSNEIIPNLETKIITHGDNWTKMVLGKQIHRYHGDSWKRIEWRTAICADFIQVASNIGDFNEDVFLWVEDDIIVGSKFANVFKHNNLPFHWEILAASLVSVHDNKYSGSGFVAVAFKKPALSLFLDSMRKRWIIDPIDWILNYHGDKYGNVRSLDRGYVTHMETSSTLGCDGPSSNCKN
tara:strand:+ start:320 stop:1099 length:780 start_codon:yes stop_codon:yes gene_type:complete